jgi:hypothetical protein
MRCVGAAWEPRPFGLGDTRLQRHDDLAEMPVGVHVREGLADVVKGEDAIDRQLQLALLDRNASRSCSAEQLRRPGDLRPASCDLLGERGGGTEI